MCACAKRSTIHNLLTWFKVMSSSRRLIVLIIFWTWPKLNLLYLSGKIFSSVWLTVCLLTLLFMSVMVCILATLTYPVSHIDYSLDYSGRLCAWAVRIPFRIPVVAYFIDYNLGLARSIPGTCMAWHPQAPTWLETGGDGEGSPDQFTLLKDY